MKTIISKLNGKTPDDLLKYLRDHLNDITDPENAELWAVLDAPLDYHNLQRIIDIISNLEDREEIHLND